MPPMVWCSTVGRICQENKAKLFTLTKISDLLLISDEDVWNYGQAVRKMVRDHGFDQNIKVVHAMEILGVVEQSTRTDLTEEDFYRTINSSRDMIKNQFCQPEESIQKLVDEDIDSRLTYNGMRTFVKIDLENTSVHKNAGSRKEYLKEMSTLALKMMARSEGFGHLIRAAMPNHIRLSIHPSYGAAKLSICLVPQLPGCQARAPWMSCIAVDRNGANHTAHVKDVRVTHQLVYENELPWKYVEREAPPLPEFLVSRNQMFEEMWQDHTRTFANKTRSEIKVILDHGTGSYSVVNGVSWKSTPASLMFNLSDEFRNKVIAAKINSETCWDLTRPLEKDCTVTYLTYESSEGPEIFWRSCATCLAELCEQEFHCLLSESTPLAQGFFCDMSMLGRYVHDSVILWMKSRLT